MTRMCGDCSLCCRLLPVRSIGKLDGQRCKHQRHTGCRVYHGAEFPSECRIWNRRWLVDQAGETSRPDRSHIVIDIMPDYVRVKPDSADDFQPVEVVQCWIDPRYPDAHKDPEFRAFVEARAAEGILTIVRTSAKVAFILVAPCLSASKAWEEVHPQMTEETHTPRQVLDALGKRVRNE